MNPHDIPNGYSEDKHRALENTIAKPGDYSCLTANRIHIMACHETHDTHCIGWLMNQLGSGNNIGLRLHVRNCENAKQIKLAGEQHETFEETLPSAPIDASHRSGVVRVRHISFYNTPTSCHY